LVYEKTQTFDLKGKSLDDFRGVVEFIMQNSLDIQTKSAKIDDSLIIITFIDAKKDKVLQKDNKIAVYREQDSVYVQMKGEITDSEVSTFWSQLEKGIEGAERDVEEKPASPTQDAIFETKAAPEQPVDWDMARELKKLSFYDDLLIIQLKKMVADLNLDKKKHVVNRVKDLIKQFSLLEDEGVQITASDKAKYIRALIKSKKADRDRKLRELVLSKKALTKDEIIDKIINSILEKGEIIEKPDAQDFVENFQEQYNRLPVISEIDSIAAGYVRMKQADAPSPAPIKETDIEEQDFLEDIDDGAFLETPPEEMQITPTDALKEMIREHDYLSDQEKEYFANYLDKVEIEGQKKIVANLEVIQENLAYIPDLSNDDAVKLRKELINSTEEEIIGVISQIIKQREQEEEGEWDPEKKLRKLGFLTEANITVILKMIGKLPEERQQTVIDRLKEIEIEYEELEGQGIDLTDWEKGQFRIELVKLTKKNRLEKLTELTKDKKEEAVKEKLFSEIPQLKFEDNEKIIKELIWLSKDEMDKRIQKIKKGISKKLEKKQELFEKSTAGSTCPECGWPVGSFTKKCPRCGYVLIDWMS